LRGVPNARHNCVCGKTTASTALKMKVPKMKIPDFNVLHGMKDKE
jgi:hypothetical protein